MPHRLALLLLVAVTLVGGTLAWRLGIPDLAFSVKGHSPRQVAAFTLEARPQSDQYIFDYGGALRHYEEGTQRYLERLASRFHIESLIVSVPALPSDHNVETLAVDLVNRWRIGAQHDGRGLLLLLVDDIKSVKLEVGYALEDVFTDSFSGYVEDLQLGPYYRAGDVGTGLIAVMEMLEQRAQMKNQGDFSPELIARADAQLLAGGAGAKRELASYAAAGSVSPKTTSGRGARSPEEAWETMLTKWAGKGNDIHVDIYTKMTRLAMGDPNQADPRTLQWLEHWRDSDYQVLRDENHAVIWFGAIDGWENAPFLFCNTGKGWKFDIVHQRRLVVMAESPKWQVALGPYPYIELMEGAWQSTGKDLPLAGEDLYRCAKDEAIATRMAELRTIIDRDPQNTAATLALLRLNVITGQRPNLVRPLIESAKRLAPKSTVTWKYSAIFNVNSFFQYQTALSDMEQYIELRPDDPFGYNMKGFLLYRLGRYKHSLEALQRAAELDPANGYTYALMARDYTLLARRGTAATKDRYRKRAFAMRHQAEKVSAPDSLRLQWLRTWMRRRIG